MRHSVIAVAAVVLSILAAGTAAAQCNWTPASGSVYQTCGDVGIGIKDPTVPLQIFRSSGQVNVYLQSGTSDPGSGGVIRFFSGGVERATLRSDLEQGALVIETGSPTAERMRITPSGNVGIGTTAPAANLDVSFNGNPKVRINGADSQNDRFPELELRSGNTDAGSHSTIRFSKNGGLAAETLHLKNGAGANAMTLDGAGNANFAGTVTAQNVVAKYQDVAEWVPATGALAPGTVVVLDASRSNTVTASSVAYDTRVAGVVSPQPGILLGEAGASKLPIATTGRVRVRVDATSAAIGVGDLLVTSDTPGVAMKSEPMELNGRRFHQPGTIVGKALEPLKDGTGEILVLLSMQ